MKKQSKLILILCTVVFILSGCNSENIKNSKAVVEEFLTCYKSLDENSGNYLVGQTSNELVEFNGVQAEIAQKLTFKVDKVKKCDDDTYIVNTTITVPDFAKAFEIVQSEYTDTDNEETIIKNLTNKISAEDVSMKEFIIPISVREDDEVFKIEMTEDLMNALSGGYYEYISSIVEDMYSE